MTKQTIVLAAITPLAAAQVAKAFVGAVNKVETGQHTFMRECQAAAALIGMPITASQYDAQIAPLMREQFKAKAKKLAETTAASYRSRIKTFCLAACSQVEGFAPIAGETMATYLSRIAEPLASAKLADGRMIWDKVKEGRTATAKGSKQAPAAKSGGMATVATVNDDEGGLDIKPALAAALILARGNQSRAQRLVVVLGNYAEEFDRWTATILSDDDKAKLGNVVMVETETTANVVKAEPALTTLGAALVEGQRKANAKRKAA